jgi:autotransporter-associated beta strand protein
MNKTTIALLTTAVAVLLSLQSTRAGSATWNLNPTSNNWNTAANWTPATVPNSSIDTATFAVSNVTGITLTATTTVASLIFNPGASAYTFNAPIFPADLNITGVGIVNNSGVVQTFTSTPQQSTIVFRNSATAGDFTSFIGPFSFAESSTAGTANFVLFPGGPVSVFSATSNAGHASLLVPGSPTFAAQLSFSSNSSAASANITAQGASTTNGVGGVVNLLDTATAGTATIIAEGATAVSPNGHSVIGISGRSNAGNAILIATGGTNGGNGGRIVFSDTADGSGARAEMFGNGELDTSLNHAIGVSLGSIEGDGLIFLGGRPLTLTGALNTIFSGVIQDGGIAGGTGGSLVQAGSGTLTLSGASIYTGGTTVNSGILKVANVSGSATGTGAVLVNAGTLGGKGRISGAVTIGTGSGAGAVLTPSVGSNQPARLTLGRALTLKTDSTYTCKLNTNIARADQVISKGVTIESGAQFILATVANRKLTTGAVFTVMSNTANTPISGVFTNLSDGGTIIIGSNTFQANYEGGDGNDLTLTVVSN